MTYTETWAVIVGNEERFRFSADWSRASAPIRIDEIVNTEGGPFGTPFQVGDAGHNPYKAARLLIDSWDGFPIIEEDESWELELIDD